MNKNYFSLLLLFFIAANMFAQADTKKQFKGVIKTEISGVASQVNFYQLGYEFQIENNNSFQLSAGFGSTNGVNAYALGIQNRFYLGKAIAPEGLHLGPRVLAIYAETNERNPFNGNKNSVFGFELDAIFGYQFIIADLLALDPYVGVGLAVIDSETQLGLVLGGTLGFAF